MRFNRRITRNRIIDLQEHNVSSWVHVSKRAMSTTNNSLTFRDVLVTPTIPTSTIAGARPIPTTVAIPAIPSCRRHTRRIKECTLSDGAPSKWQAVSQSRNQGASTVCGEWPRDNPVRTVTHEFIVPLSPVTKVSEKDDKIITCENSPLLSLFAVGKSTG